MSTNQAATNATNKSKEDIPAYRNSHKRRSISSRLGTVAGIAAAIVIAVEIAARVTRATHNRRVRHLGSKLNVTVAGSGEPVVFLHGFRGSGRYWEPHVRELTAHHQIIIVDLLGFGESPWPQDASYDVGNHLDAIDRTIEPLVRGRRVTIVGHSMGAILAAEYARRHRKAVSGVILLNAPMFRSEAEARSRIKEMSPMAAMFSVRRFWARASCDLVCAFRPLLFDIAPRLEPEIPPHVARDAVLHRWESFDRTLRRVVLQSNMEQTLRQLGPVPVTILHGTRDRVTLLSRLKTIASEIHAELVVIPGGHNIYLDTPHAVVREIERAIARSQ